MFVRARARVCVCICIRLWPLEGKRSLVITERKIHREGEKKGGTWKKRRKEKINKYCILKNKYI